MQMQRITYYCFLTGKLKMTAKLSFTRTFASFSGVFFGLFRCSGRTPCCLGRFPTSTDPGRVIVSVPSLRGVAGAGGRRGRAGAAGSRSAGAGLRAGGCEDNYQSEQKRTLACFLSFNAVVQFTLQNQGSSTVRMQ